MKRYSIPLTLCFVGGVVALAGELMGASNRQRGDTISEVFKSLPLWLKLLTFWILGAVCAHLAEWQISPNTSQVNVEGNVNIEKIEEAHDS